MLFNVSDFKDSYKDELEKYRSMLPGTITDFRGFMTGYVDFENQYGDIEQRHVSVSCLEKAQEI